MEANKTLDLFSIFDILAKGKYKLNQRFVSVDNSHSDVTNYKFNYH